MITEIKGTERFNKVVVTLDVESPLSPTLELAIALAVASRSKLHGLFIEDMDLLRVASLPFTREVTLASGQQRTLDIQKLLRAFNAKSRYFRQSLEQYAQQSNVTWTYSTVRGEKRSMELAESAEAKFLIIGRPIGRPSQVLNPKRILLIDDQSPELYQAVDVVLANFPHQPIELLLVPSGKASSSDSVLQLNLKLKTHPHSHLIEINPDTLTTTLAQKAQIVDYVIVSRQDAESLQQIMQRATCPVIVVC